MKNLNLLFNKTYYRNIKYMETDAEKKEFARECQAFNEEICGVKFDEARDYRSLEPLKDRMKTIELVTTYPGMLVGTGYAHGTSESDNDVKIGFSFDYVTGQPYVPGSSVKGLLRCVFREQPEAAAEIVRVCTGKELTVEIIKELEKKIFDFGDVFLDAVVCKGNAGGYLMGLDHITPHSEPTKNPVPILLLKILPGVHFEFRFVLKDDGILTADEKLKVFETMLTLFGAGAKTNVGYGQLVRACDYQPPQVVRNPAPAPAQTGGGTDRGSRTNSGNNRSNNYNNNHGSNRSQPAQTAEEPVKVHCPLCGEKTWIRYPDGNLRKTCSVCKGTIDMGAIISKL